MSLRRFQPCASLSPDQSRNQHFLAGPHAAPGVRAALGRGRLRRSARHAHCNGRVPGLGGRAGRGSQHASTRDGESEWAVEDAAYQAMTDAIVDAVAQGCDAVLLDLHGAMVTDTAMMRKASCWSECAPLLRRPGCGGAGPARQCYAPHGRARGHRGQFRNLPACGHVRNRRKGRASAGAHARRRDQAVIAWRRLLYDHTLRVATARGAMRRAVQAARQAEREGLLSASYWRDSLSPTSRAA